MATRSKGARKQRRISAATSEEGPSTLTAESSSQPVHTVPLVFEESPVHTQCSSCKSNCYTEIKYDVGSLTWSVCFVIALSGLFLGCCLAPFFTKGTKDILHVCPDCDYVIARYNKL